MGRKAEPLLAFQSMVWSATKCTLWFDGPQVAKAQLQAAIVAAIASNEPPPQPAKHVKTIFVVHGHDTAAKEPLELTLHRLCLTPYVLQDVGGGGKTIIEDLEKMIGKSPTSTFGIVLLNFRRCRLLQKGWR